MFHTEGRAIDVNVCATFSRRTPSTRARARRVADGRYRRHLKFRLIDRRWKKRAMSSRLRRQKRLMMITSRQDSSRRGSSICAQFREHEESPLSSRGSGIHTNQIVFFPLPSFFEGGDGGDGGGDSPPPSSLRFATRQRGSLSFLMTAESILLITSSRGDSGIDPPSSSSPPFDLTPGQIRICRRLLRFRASFSSSPPPREFQPPVVHSYNVDGEKRNIRAALP